MANSIFLGRLNAEQRKALIERLWHAQGGKCFITGKDINLSLHEGELDIDHVIPLTNGGKDDESNFALTFSSANRSKQGADLNLARINWQFKELSEKLQHEENRNPNLTDILAIYAKGSYEMTFKINGDKITFTFPKDESHQIFEQPIYTDQRSGIRYFFTVAPIEYIMHDKEINPRSIGSNVSKLIAEFYKGNPQLHIALGYIDNLETGKSAVKLFDGQHKAAAQIMLGTKSIPIRVFVDPDKEMIRKTNFNAGTTLRQVAFDKSVQRHLGSKMYRDRVERYQVEMNRDANDFSFSEKVLINFYKGESKEMRRYIIDNVKDGITYAEDNKLRDYIDMGGRGKERPLSYSTVEKTFYSFFIYQEPLESNLDFKMEEGMNPRDVEKRQIVRLMNIIADVILIDKFDFEVGTYRIENKIQQGEPMDWNHVVAYRMMKEEILYSWLSYILNIINMYYAQTGRPIYGRKDFFQEAFPDQLWLNIENFIKNLANLPFWKSVELSSTVFGGKSNYDFWKKIFATGKSPQGETILAAPLDITSMIIPIG